MSILARTLPGKEEALPGSILLVIHDFVARSADELSLAKGDRIELIERDDDFGDGWFLGRHMANGTTGLFPEVYTTPAPRGTLAAAHQRRISEGRIPQSADASLQPRPGSNGSLPQSTPSSVSHNALRSSIASNASSTRTAAFSVDSPVMNETLSVINEHITDMSTPRSSLHGDDAATRRSSVYSLKNSHRFSYIPGHETDEDEGNLHSEEEVMAWTPDQVAEYLEDHGVEKLHCDVFREQEISGEVLLAMDQSSLFIKEFQLGPVGRRLKTWHKVKALQEEIKRHAASELARTASAYSAEDGAVDKARNRSSTVGAPALPRALETRGSAEGSPQGRPGQSHSRSPAPFSPLQTVNSATKPTARPSAQSIRAMNSRRHSSLDTTPDLGAVRGHSKQSSIDRTWSTAQSTDPYAATPVTDVDGLPAASPGDVDKGYFSSTELEASRSRTRKVLTKPPSANNSPSGSKTDLFGRDKPAPSRESAPAGRHHSFNNAMSAVTDRFSGLRSATTPQPQSKPMRSLQDNSHPVVTKLEHSNSVSGTTTASPATAHSETSSADFTPSPSAGTFGILASYRSKLSGLRATSDAVTKEERAGLTAHADKGPSTKDEITSPPRTGSTTPSTETQSFDLQKSDIHSRTSAGSGPVVVPPPPSKRRIRTRGKKMTSAYTRGLEKKSPADAMADCDYSGWMKKKSGSLMTTWKPRLFVLRGRRLSYYYRDDDTEEKGLIDISFHRVLPASNETITGIHAALTGAASPTSPKEHVTTNAERDLAARVAVPEGGEDLFIFKLVPPKVGLSKAVNFTKPTVHYFAVPSRAEGRLWMAALMKATIDRDDESVVTTTYNQKTISLQKARARKERPPALKDEEEEVEEKQADQGLGINGLDGEGQAEAGAERTGEEKAVDDGASSVVASTVNTEAEILDDEKKIEATVPATVNATA